MWPDRVSNPGPLTYESGAVPTALRSPAPLGSDQPARTFKAGQLAESFLSMFILLGLLNSSKQS